MGLGAQNPHTHTHKKPLPSIIPPLALREDTDGAYLGAEGGGPEEDDGAPGVHEGLNGLSIELKGLQKCPFLGLWGGPGGEAGLRSSWAGHRNWGNPGR